MAGLSTINPVSGLTFGGKLIAPRTCGVAVPVGKGVPEGASEGCGMGVCVAGGATVKNAGQGVSVTEGVRVGAGDALGTIVVGVAENAWQAPARHASRINIKAVFAR